MFFILYNIAILYTLWPNSKLKLQQKYDLQLFSKILKRYGPYHPSNNNKSQILLFALMCCGWYTLKKKNLKVTHKNISNHIQTDRLADWHVAKQIVNLNWNSISLLSWLHLSFKLFFHVKEIFLMGMAHTHRLTFIYAHFGSWECVWKEKTLSMNW